MAVFTKGIVPWNSLDDNTRLPLTSELEGGYPCGQADQQLFNFTAGYSWGQVHNVIVSAGLSVDRTNLLQLGSALQTNRIVYASAAGTANAIVANFTPAIEALNVGMRLLIRPALNNTSSATINVNGLGAIPITGIGAVPLVANDIVAGNFIELVYDGTRFVAISGLSSMTGFGSILLSTPGPVTFTVPARTNIIDVQIWGGGGGGGGVGSGGGGSAGGGGGAGYSRRRLSVSPGAVLTGNLGAGGTGGLIGGNGGDGGTTTFAGMTATGGFGGKPNPSGDGGGGGSASGGDINIGGTGASSGGAGASIIGGQGSGSPFGGPGGGGGLGASSGGAVPGGGGGGAGSAAANKGGAGGNGLIIISW